jgi:hypothetical protein
MSRFTGLPDALKAAADKPKDEENPVITDENDDGTEPKSKKKDKDMSTETPVEQTAEYQAGFKAANDRLNAVTASEHYAGREPSAHAMLGKSMSASDIIDILATQPKIEPATIIIDPAAATAAAEEAGKATMLAALNEQTNAALDDSSGDAKPNAKVDVDKTWNRAYGLEEKGAK